MIFWTTASIERGMSAATTREVRFATATPGAASQTYFITGGIFFSARMRSAHLGLGISSAGLASLPAGLPTKARVLTTGSPILNGAAPPCDHVPGEVPFCWSARLLPTQSPCNLLISKDLRNWPNSCSAIFFVVAESSTRNRTPAKKNRVGVLSDNQGTLDVSKRSYRLENTRKT